MLNIILSLFYGNVGLMVSHGAFNRYLKKEVREKYSETRNMRRYMILQIFRNLKKIMDVRYSQEKNKLQEMESSLP